MIETGLVYKFWKRFCFVVPTPCDLPLTKISIHVATAKPRYGNSMEFPIQNWTNTSRLHREQTNILISKIQSI
jgi:hypothetical protein